MSRQEFESGMVKMRQLASHVGVGVNVLHHDTFNRILEVSLQLESNTVVDTQKEALYQFDQSFVDDLGGSRNYWSPTSRFFESVSARLQQPGFNTYTTVAGYAIGVEIHWPFEPTQNSDVRWVHVTVRSATEQKAVINVCVTVDGQDRLENGISGLHPPLIEELVINAVRRALDLKTIQLEPSLAESRELQPVPIKLGRTQAPAPSEEIEFFLQAKAYWLGFRHGDIDAFVSLRDPYDASYLGVTLDEIRRAAQVLRARGDITLASQSSLMTLTDHSLLKLEMECGRRTALQSPSPRVDATGGATPQPPRKGGIGNSAVGLRFDDLDGRAIRRAKAMDSDRQWDVFISHASEDKEGFVRPLVDELRKSVRVWFDEFELRLGDSLRQKIDEGLAASRFGVVILSESFFAKHWPQAELDGLVSREVDGLKVILPVWHGVDESEVAKFSPLLAGRVAASSSKGVAYVAKQIVREISSDAFPVPNQAPTADLEAQRRLESIVQSIRHVRVTNRLYPELHRLREFLIAHPLVYENCLWFFEKWLIHPLVEVGMESGGWSRDRVQELHTDLDALVTSFPGSSGR